MGNLKAKNEFSQVKGSGNFNRHEIVRRLVLKLYCYLTFRAGTRRSR